MPYAVLCRAVQGRARPCGTVGTERLHWCRNSPRLRVCTQCPVHSLVRSKLSLRLGVPFDCAPRGRGVAAQMNTPCRYDERMSLKEDYDYTAAVACRAHCTSAYCAAHRLQLLRRTGRRRTYVLASASALCSLRCHCPPRNSTRQQNFGTAQSAQIYFPVQNMRCFQYARRQTEPRTNENAAVRCCGRIDVAQS
jgi:hypothetical protein